MVFGNKHVPFGNTGHKQVLSLFGIRGKGLSDLSSLDWPESARRIDLSRNNLKKVAGREGQSSVQWPRGLRRHGIHYIINALSLWINN